MKPPPTLLLSAPKALWNLQRFFFPPYTLHPFSPPQCPFKYTGFTANKATDPSRAYPIAAGVSCWDETTWNQVGGMYDTRQT